MAESHQQDPENPIKYGEKVCNLMGQLISLCIWSPVSNVLHQDTVKNPENAQEHFKKPATFPTPLTISLCLEVTDGMEE